LKAWLADAAQGALPQALNPRRPGHARLLEAVSTYLPLLLMGVLAMGSWWLVKNSPLPAADTPVKAPRHEPDYTMQGFTVQRFAPSGQLRAQIQGEVLRHYPDTDTTEIHQVRLRSIGENAVVTQGRAQRGLSNGDGSEVQLIGDARVERQASAGQEAAIFSSEFLHFFANTEQVRSHLPITLQQGSTVIKGDSLEYDHRSRVVVVKGKVRATFPAAAQEAASPGR
jgi:lipopolysaccharide export system protein LptC